MKNGFGFCVAESTPVRFSFVDSVPSFVGLHLIGIRPPVPDGISKLQGIRISGSSEQLRMALKKCV